MRDGEGIGNGRDGDWRGDGERKAEAMGLRLGREGKNRLHKVRIARFKKVKFRKTG